MKILPVHNIHNKLIEKKYSFKPTVTEQYFRTTNYYLPIEVPSLNTNANKGAPGVGSKSILHIKGLKRTYACLLGGVLIS